MVQARLLGATSRGKAPLQEGVPSPARRGKKRSSARHSEVKQEYDQPLANSHRGSGSSGNAMTSSQLSSRWSWVRSGVPTSARF